MAEEKDIASHLDDLPSSGDLEILELDPVTEKKLLRKLDRWIIPMMTLAYLSCFLDRSNIGNARLYGLEDDLNMHGNQYQTSVSLFFVTYVIFEIPSNLVIKKVGASRWISFIAVGWGIVATLTGVCQTYGGLIACRLILGLFEAGLFPGLAIYLTMFYTKKEIALRVGYLFVSAALSGACGGLLAYGIGLLDHHNGLRGWRWIFIIEGIDLPQRTRVIQNINRRFRSSHFRLRHCSMVPPCRQSRDRILPHSRREKVDGHPTRKADGIHTVRCPASQRGCDHCVQGLENMGICLWPVRIHIHALRIFCLLAHNHQR